MKLIGSFPLDDDNVAEPGHAGSGSAFEEQLMSLEHHSRSITIGYEVKVLWYTKQRR